MTYVYLLESIASPGQVHIGHTGDLRARLADHNSGKSPHTAEYKPWRLVTYLAFSDEAKAIAFERYLKTGSGRALIAGESLRNDTRRAAGQSLFLQVIALREAEQAAT